MRTAEQEMLQHWLVERALDCALAKGDAAGSAPPDPSAQNDLKDGPLAPGQIRLLAPALSPGSPPRYVAVCGSGMDTDTLIPFGRYAHPALPGECATALTAAPLRVACLWTATSVDAMRAAQNSWLAGTLAPAVVRAMSEALTDFRTGRTPRPESTGASGPRLTHPRDPRHDYIEEERSLADTISHSCGTQGAPSDTLYQMPRPDTTRRVAAEDHTPYGRVHDLAIAGTVLRLRWDSASGQNLVHIEAENGEISEHFDGAWLQDQDGNCSSPIWNGQLQVPAALIETSTQLTRPEGSIYKLLRTR